MIIQTRDILEWMRDIKRDEARRKKQAVAEALTSFNNSSAKSDEYGNGSCVDAHPRENGNMVCAKSTKNCTESSKTSGKFQSRIRRALIPTKNGKLRNVAKGQHPHVVPMDVARMKKINALMVKNDGFGDGANMNSINVMVDHFTVLMILKNAYLKNGHGKGDKYPRHLRIFFGPDGFQRQDQIITANRDAAEAIARRHVVENVIHTQNVNVLGQKMNAMSAPEKQREHHIKKLTKNFMFGFNVYAQLLKEVNDGTLVLPDARQNVADQYEIGSEALRHPTERFHAICDADSPCVSDNERD